MRATVVALLTFACGSENSSSDEQRQVVDLTFTREDGSNVEMPTSGIAVWCGPWEGDEVPDQTLHVNARGVDLTNVEAFWVLKAVLEDVRVGEPASLPNDFIWDQPEGIEFFAVDAPNELSGAEAEASGAVRFDALDCTEGGRVEVTVDVVLGSEFGGGETLKVVGRFSSPVPF